MKADKFYIIKKTYTQFSAYMSIKFTVEKYLQRLLHTFFILNTKSTFYRSSSPPQVSIPLQNVGNELSHVLLKTSVYP